MFLNVNNDVRIEKTPKKSFSDPPTGYPPLPSGPGPVLWEGEGVPRDQLWALTTWSRGRVDPGNPYTVLKYYSRALQLAMF